MSGAQCTLTGRLAVALPPEAAFTLFTPRGEELWVAGWQPRFQVRTSDRSVSDAFTLLWTHVDATPIRFDLPVPGDLLPRLTWRNARGKTQTLKYVTEDGRLEHSVSLQGFYRLTPESASELDGLVSGTLV